MFFFSALIKFIVLSFCINSYMEMCAKYVKMLFFLFLYANLIYHRGQKNE